MWPEVSKYENMLLVRSRGAASGGPGVSYSSRGSARHPLTCSHLSAEASSLFSKSPFFSSWDSDVLRMYLEYALIEDASGQVRLKCTNLQVWAQVGTRAGPTDRGDRKPQCLRTRADLLRHGWLYPILTEGFR